MSLEKYTVTKIEEDIDFGCEERAADEPVMAIVTLKDENDHEMTLRYPDQMLYDSDINEGDTVAMKQTKEGMFLLK